MKLLISIIAKGITASQIPCVSYGDYSPALFSSFLLDIVTLESITLYKFSNIFFKYIMILPSYNSTIFLPTYSVRLLRLSSLAWL